MMYNFIDSSIALKYKVDFINFFCEVLTINNIIRDSNEIEIMFNDMIEYLNDKTANVICAFDDEKIVGFIWFYKRVYNNEERYHINHFIVDKKYRKCGIGRKLMNMAIDHAKNNNINKIELNATYSNENTMKFYYNCGFEIERVSMVKYLDN